MPTFDGQGKILESFERFTNVIFPPQVRNHIYRAHPGWTVKGNKYLLSYSHNKGKKKVNKIRIGKGDLQKKLKIGAEGNLL